MDAPDIFNVWVACGLSGKTREAILGNRIVGDIAVLVKTVHNEVHIRR